MCPQPVVHCQAANRLVTWTKNFTVTADFTRQRASLVSASPVVEHGSMLTTLCLCINQNLLDSRLPYDAWVDINQRDIHCNDVSFIFKYCFCDFTRRLYHFTPQKCSPQSRVQNSKLPTFLTSPAHTSAHHRKVMETEGPGIQMTTQ